jgi:type I restriction enzyme, S subunit
MVPKGWQKCSLADALNYKMGFAFRSADFVDEGLQLIRMANLYQNRLDTSRAPVFLPERFADEYPNYVLQPDDLIMSLTGTMGKRDYGFAVQIPPGSPGLLLNQRVVRLDCKTGFDKAFMLHLLQFGKFLNQLYRLPGGTKQANLSISSLLSISLPLPPLPEQQKIAAILSTWDRAIELTEKLIAAKQKRKQALMQQLLSGKVRFKEFANNPWPTKTLDEIGQFHKGKGISKSDICDNGVPAILYGELYTTHVIVVRRIKSYIDHATADASFCVQSGDILFPTSGETAEEIGKPAVYLTKDAVYAGGDIVVFRPTEGDPLFLTYALNSQDSVKYRWSVAQGQSVVHIYKKNLQEHPIPFPSATEQHRIAGVLDELQREIESLACRTGKLKQQKKGLMQQLLTGKVRVKTKA